MDTISFLKQNVPLFYGVSEEHLSSLAAASETTSFSKGQTVLFKGGTVDGLHVVVTGKVSVSMKVQNKGVVTLAELGAGEVFGETSIVEMGTAGAAVKSVEDGTTVLVIPQESFRRVLQADELFAVRVNTLIRSRKVAPSVPA